MAWQTPKTNWQAADVVSKDDFNRIEGNIQELQDTKETSAGAQAKANTAEANAKAYTNAHEQKAAPHSGHETPAGAQAKAEAAAGTVQSALNSHKAAVAPHSGHETPAGAQAKVDAAEARAKAYTDQEVAEVSQALDAHLAEKATEQNLGHVKVDGETITVSSYGIISAQTQIVDTVTSDKWKWGMEDGIVFLEKVVV
jgi:hypothetical protein